MRTKKELISIALVKVGSSREYHSATAYLEAIIDELEEFYLDKLDEFKLVAELQKDIQQCLNVLRKEV